MRVVIPTHTDPAIAAARAAARHAASPSFESPSATYYWFRKRRVVRNLITRNAQAIAASGSDTSTFAEFGCGSGIDLVQVRNVLLTTTARAWRAVAFDANPLNLDQARARADVLDLADVEFRLADFNRGIPLESGTLHFGYCSEVLEHLPSPDAFLGEVRRVVLPGGHFLMTTPNEPNPLQRSFWSKRRRRGIDSARSAHIVDVAGTPTEIYDHISLHTAQEWDLKIKRAGFTLIDWGRGSLVYGGRERYDHELALAGLFLAQLFLDAIPGSVSRRLTDQVLALYRAV
jgi:SAM-dependent methyltransferase